MTHDAGTWFYWELPPNDRGPAAERSDVSEVRLALEINHGRRLAATVPNSDQWKTLVPAPDFDERPGGEVHVYSDPIAAILQAARYVGLTPATIFSEAIDTSLGIYTDALDDVSRRNDQLDSGGAPTN